MHPGKTTNFDAPHPEWKYLTQFIHQKQTPQSKEGQRSMASPDKASRLVSEGAQNEPRIVQTSIPPTQSEINETIEEQANHQVLNPPPQQTQEEVLPSVPIIHPVLPEKTN